MPKSKNYTIADRVQVLTLAEEGKPYAKITEITGMSKSQITRLCQKARERGYDPSVSKQIKAEHVKDAPRSGRPEVIDDEKEKKVLDIVRATHESREMSIAELAKVVGVGTTAVYKLFKKKKMGKYKPTYRPGLTAKMRKARLEFALKYKDKELEWWKNVIFSDETSIVLGGRQGKTRVWRRTSERFYKTCIR